ncbi:formimidoylglutamate deiminase [Kineosporia rhizophila]|uniref:formimidoylglutamate deiminase n=1 Tax=Kineosporia rhizophila TaxID=84633 RepID=UPI001E29BEE6|nr:formimidoylglutamate deiminase [Kineosporia rhizophila]MCE0535945.1 formimidoylglutamate deiminase [Kineosporia rhizophila]
MKRYWAPHAWLPSGMAASVRISVEPGGTIAALESGVAADAGDERLPGVVLPGLANAHSHAFHRALRGRTHADGGSFWTWRTVMYDVAQKLDPDSYLALARAVYAEMALAGITTVGEFHYLHHDRNGRRYADPNAMGEALRQAAADAGIRITLLDTCYLAGGLTADGYTELNDVQQRFGDGDAEAWAERVSSLRPSAGMRVGAAIHSVRAVPRDQLGAVAAFTRMDEGRDAPLHVHLSEQPAENQACLDRYGLTPTGLLKDAGVLGPQTSLVHATHLTDTDIKDLSGTFACFCPTTERDLADGIGPARALAEAGATLTLGSDQHAVIDLFEEARALEMHERLSTLQRGRFSPDQLLTALTESGQRSLGWPELGQIRVGAPADLVAVRLDSVRTAGSAPEQITLSATAPDVDTVLVGGEVVVSQGRHRLGDVGALLTDALETLHA